MIKDINAITPEYMKHRLEEETEQYKQEIERLNNRIDKAIEYIESYINQFNGVYPTVDMRYLDLHKLLEILDKGE